MEAVSVQSAGRRLTARLALLFLGTGSRSLRYRNGSATALSITSQPVGNDPERPTKLWLFDCAEGTARQLLTVPQPERAQWALDRLEKIFLTNLNLNHVGGLAPLMRTRLPSRHGAPPKPIDIYGPRGTRALVRASLSAFAVSLGQSSFAVHELLAPSESPSVPAGQGAYGERDERDVFAGPDGLWRRVVSENDVVVDAGALANDLPCRGYVTSVYDRAAHADIHEHPLARVALLGNTNDASQVLPLCADADVLVHDATIAQSLKGPSLRAASHALASAAGDTSLDDAAASWDGSEGILPPELSQLLRGARVFDANDSQWDLPLSAVRHGNSTAAMAGEFAHAAGARRLCLNHVSKHVPAIEFKDIVAAQRGLRDERGRGTGAIPKLLALSLQTKHAERGWKYAQNNARMAQETFAGEEDAKDAMQPPPMAFVQDFDEVYVDVEGAREDRGPARTGLIRHAYRRWSGRKRGGSLSQAEDEDEE